MLFYKLIKRVLKFNTNNNNLEKIVIFFSVGLSFNLSISFLINIFRIATFLTLYLPVILIDIVYLSILLYKKKNKKRSLKNAIFLLKRLSIKALLILCIIFVIVFISLWNIITQNPSLIHTDPFGWFNRTSDVFEKGFLDHFGPGYPQGYRILLFTCLSVMINPDYKITYFFFKFSPIYLSFFYIIVMFILIRRISKKNYFLIIGLILVISSYYLKMRFLQFLPSNIATLIFLISLIPLVSNHPLYFLGFYLTLIYFLNPLISFYAFILILLYIVMKFLYTTKEIKILFFNITKMILISSVLFIPYILFIYSYGFNIIYIFSYFERFEISFLFMNKIHLMYIDSIPFIKSIIDFLTSWISDDPIWVKNYYLRNTTIFSFFFVFAILILFLPIKNAKNKQNIDLRIIGKCVIVIIVLIFFLPAFFPSNYISELFTFRHYLRSLEFFTPMIILSEIISIEYLINKIKSYNEVLKKKVNKKIFLNSKLNFIKKISADKIIVLILVITANTNYYVINNERSYVGGYHFSSENIEAMFFIKDKLPKGSKILVYNHSFNTAFNCLYLLLNDYVYEIWEFSKSNIYNITITYSFDHKINYTLLSINLINVNELNFFINDSTNIEIIFNNSENIIFQTIFN